MRRPTPSWQQNLARIRNELQPGFQDLLDITFAKINEEQAACREKLTESENDRMRLLAESLKDTPATAPAHLEKMTRRAPAHFCQDEHEPIWHNDSEHELCPLCRVTNDRDALRERVGAMMNYPDLRKYVGSDIYDKVQAALAAKEPR